MNRGLLQYLENEAQFAFVMGHEMGHVAARHSAARQSRATLGSAGHGILGVAADAAGLGGIGSLAVGAAGAGTQLLLLSYDRGQELQADQLGVLYMARAGYDPSEAVRAHEVLNRAIDAHLANLGQRRGDPSVISQILSTTPDTRSASPRSRPTSRRCHPPRYGSRVTGVTPSGGCARRSGAAPGARLRPVRRSLQAFALAARAAQQKQDSVVRQKLAESQREIEAAIQLADRAQFATLQGYLLAVQERTGGRGPRSIARSSSTPATSRPSGRSRGSVLAAGIGGEPSLWSVPAARPERRPTRFRTSFEPLESPRRPRSAARPRPPSAGATSSRRHSPLPRAPPECRRPGSAWGGSPFA